MEIIREHLGLPPKGFATDKRIEEIDLGKWDGLTHKEARALDPELFDKRETDKWNVRVPGGESYADVAERAERWVSEPEARHLRGEPRRLHAHPARAVRGAERGRDVRPRRAAGRRLPRAREQGQGIRRAVDGLSVMPASHHASAAKDPGGGGREKKPPRLRVSA